MTARWFDHVPSGSHGSRPAANAVPKYGLYACSTHGKIYQSDGVSTWADWLVPSSGFADPTTTKGDLITHSTVTGRKAVGADGKVLTADSTQADGLAWATPSGGSGGVLGLAIGASIPGGTAAGTLVFRKSDWIASLVADSPAALITLDEASGNFLDQSGNARDFTPGTSVTRSKTALLGDGGAAASGNGSNPIATLGSAGGIVQTGTLEAWVKIPATNVAGNPIAVGTLAAGWGINISNGAGSAGRQLCAVSPGVNYYGSGYSFPAGVDTYPIAMTLAAHTATWFVRGVKVGTATIGDASPGAGLSIGSTGAGDYLSSTVDVDHAAFFPTVLSDARIKQHAFQQPYALLGWYDGSKLQPLGLV